MFVFRTTFCSYRAILYLRSLKKVYTYPQILKIRELRASVPSQILFSLEPPKPPSSVTMTLLAFVVAGYDVVDPKNPSGFAAREELRSARAQEAPVSGAFGFAFKRLFLFSVSRLFFLAS